LDVDSIDGPWGHRSGINALSGVADIRAETLITPAERHSWEGGSNALQGVTWNPRHSGPRARRKSCLVDVGSRMLPATFGGTGPAIRTTRWTGRFRMLGASS
jgi:hypothetical protein